jgi:D-threo-aldose 1-dehydrogenase
MSPSGFSSPACQGSEIPGSGGSRIGFGCAGLMQVTSGRHRQRLLAEAFEQGIRHFDVARMYGLGAAERELGRFARRRREEIVIATKFGIEAAGAAGRLAPLQAPARAVVARFPPLRSALRRRADAFHQPHRYDTSTLRASLESSLRELGTEYVDVLFIHGPTHGDTLDMAELGDALESLRRAGRVHAWGFAGDPDPCIRLAGETSIPTILQIRDDILDGSLAEAPGGQCVITFGVLSGALRRILDHVTISTERRARWTGIIGDDCGCPEVVASLLLQDALERNPNGTVLFSTTRPERIKAATRAMQALLVESDPARLHAFRSLVLSELRSVVPVAG